MDLITVIGIILSYFILLLLIMLLSFREKAKSAKMFKVLFFVLLISGVAFMGIGWVMTAEDGDAYLVTDAEFDGSPYELYELSEDQEAYRAEYGLPSGFTLFFMEHSSVERQETWYYSDASLAVTFLNGMKLYEEESTDYTGLSPQRRYDPALFVYGAEPGAVLERIHQRDFLVMPVEASLMEDGRLYYCENLVLGFQGDELCYAETLFDGEGVRE